MSRKASTRSLSKSLNEGISPFGSSARFSHRVMDNMEDRKPLTILQNIQAAILTSVSSESGVDEV